MRANCFFTIGILGCIVAGVFWGCGTPKGAKESGSVFHYNEPGGISSLDPAFSRNTENIWAVNQVFNGLVQMDSNLNIRPCIARKWEISPDGKVYTFQLRNDVQFHDNASFEAGRGRAVVASDFAYSFNRIGDEDVASPGGYIFNYLDKTETGNFTGCKAVNDSVFEIYLKEPFPPFLGILTTAYCAVVPKEAVEYYGLDFGRNPVGTGPFQFKAWKDENKLILWKNPDYFEKENGQQLPYLDGITISFLKDRHVAFLDFIQGKLDFISGIHPTFKDEILTHKGEIKPEYKEKINIVKSPYLKTDYIGVLVDGEEQMMQDNPLKIKTIRQAINIGFDREKMVTYLRNNVGNPANGGFVPNGIPPFFSDRTPYNAYNPDKARAMLKAAGFGEENPIPEITLSTTQGYKDLCEFMQHELNNVGFTVKIDVIDEAAFRNMAAQGKLRFFRKSWIADYPDAENFLSLFYSPNKAPDGPNYSHYANPEFDALYEAAMAEINTGKRNRLYQQMDSIIAHDSPVIPLYHDEVLRLVQPGIEGLESNAMNALVLKRVKKQ